MWSSDRRRVLLGAVIVPLALMGCGFEPMYGTGTEARAGLGQVYVDVIPSEAGFVLRDWLIRQLGPSETPTHRLEVDLEIDTEGVALTTQNVTTRFDVTGIARFRLVPLDGGPTILSDSIAAVAGYSAPESETASAYASRVAEADAIDRVARQLAERIALRLSIEAPKWAGTPGGAS